MKKNLIVVLGSSRSFGNTRKAVLEILGEKSATVPIIDLSTLNITPYDYEHRNKNDDFMPLMERIVEHNIIVLATPVYWYTMSATMKIFIDRVTDILYLRDDLKQKLRNKKLFVIASFDGSFPKGTRGFIDPFEQTCDYLGIEYLGTSFIHNKTGQREFTEKNQSEIENARSILF